MDRHLLDLPPEILDMIISYLEYASEVNNLAQTCRQLSYSANARLYPYWAKQCSPAGVRRIVSNDNADALRKLLCWGFIHHLYLDDIPYSGGRAWTPFTLACERGCTKVVRALLKTYGSGIISEKNVSLAVDKGHLEVLKLLVEAGVPTEAQRDALIWVIKNVPSSILPVIRYMVTEAGFEVDYKSMYGETPLGVAAHVGKWDVFKFLAEAGAWSNRVVNLRISFDRDAPIFCAATQNNKEMVQFLLDGPARLALSSVQPDADEPDLVMSGRDAIDAIVREQTARARDALDAREGPYGSPTAMDELYEFAAASGDEALVQRLLDTEWVFEVAEDPSPLNIAAQFGHTAIIKAFLECAKNKHPMSFEDVNWFPHLIEPAVRNNHESIVKIVIDYGGKAMMSTCAARALECSIQHGRKSITALLLRHGALEEVENAQDNAMEDYGMTDILEAAYLKGDYTLIEHLLQRYGMTIFDDFTEKFDDWEQSRASNAVTAAAYYGPLEGFQKTLELGAVTLDPEEPWCHDAFRYAAYGVQPNIIRLFLDSGYNVTSGHLLLSGVLHSTCFGDRTSDDILTMIRLLLDAGVELEAMDFQGCTPLSVAAQFSPGKRSKAQTIQELLARGADPLTGLEGGTSAIQMAMKYHDMELLRTLLGVVEEKGYVLGLQPYKGEMGHMKRRRQDYWSGSEKWNDFFVTKALRQHFWRMVYPIREKGEEAEPVSAIVFPGY